MSPFPTLPFCMKISKQAKEVKVSFQCFDHLNSCELFANFEITSKVMQVNKICFTNFVDLSRLAHLPWLILQPLVASTMIIYESSLEPLAFSTENIHCESNS
jgi:hypothetical protein